MKKVMVALALVAMASLAGAASFSQNGAVLEGNYGYNYMADRVHLINDGSFEGGCGVYWICTADNTCVWIADLVPLGLWNYDGSYVYWAGGFCGGLATCYSSACQSVLIDEPFLNWWWMGYVNDSVGVNYITVDGNTVYSYVLQLSDHLLDYQQASTDITGYLGGTHEICFGVDNNAYCGANMGDNWFVDYVELSGGVANEVLSFSSVKALY